MSYPKLAPTALKYKQSCFLMAGTLRPTRGPNPVVVRGWNRAFAKQNTDEQLKAMMIHTCLR
jgi:hypothetical protein